MPKNKVGHFLIFSGHRRWAEFDTMLLFCWRFFIGLFAQLQSTRKNTK